MWKLNPLEKFPTKTSEVLFCKLAFSLGNGADFQAFWGFWVVAACNPSKAKSPIFLVRFNKIAAKLEFSKMAVSEARAPTMLQYFCSAKMAENALLWAQKSSVSL